MPSLSVSEFKATCLAVLEDVKKHKKRVLITKRGKPIAEIVPYESTKKQIPLKETVRFVGDIVSPVAENDWEVSR
ncbi:MAG: type II toxin-antitoxin system Phd/YefM family antitoxin [Syntrophaceae bacterium]|jgi:prevent-host-death family protein|nr:type II toxin-antitoxin system Phd/YefM family antitoxin [Syntrophaceae bacterium]